MLSIPFPRPFLKTYVIAAIITGLSIAFTLIVFQPFGTQNFQHEYKMWILSGYGIIAAASIILYYFISLNLINRSREGRWTIVHESLDLFLALLFGLLMCYFYFTFVFGYSIRLSGLFDFLLYASSVTILPVLGIYLYLLNEYRGIVRSTLQFEPSTAVQNSSQSILLRGTNKDDVIETSEEAIIYVKAEDNYVILFLTEDSEKIQRHMIRSTMKQLLAQLNDHIFIQCHRSFIINRNRITSLTGNKNDTKVQLEFVTKRIPVSRAKVEELRSLI